MSFRNLVVACVGVLLLTVFSQGAPKEAKKLTIPDGLLGFSGQLQGKVACVSDNGRRFCLKVTKVSRLWKNNKAENPKAAVGKTLAINAQWVKADKGAWRPSRWHVGFVRSLKVGEAITIEAINDEGEGLHILELSKEQRRRAEK